MTRAIFLLVLVALHNACAGQNEERVVKPEIRAGDSWTYRSTTVVTQTKKEARTLISFSDGKAIIAVSTTISDEKEFDASWTSEWNSVTSSTGLMYRPHSGVFRFPMRVGDTHSVDYEVLRPRTRKVLLSATSTSTVVGWETVEVPAGKFRALKVATEINYHGKDGGRAFPQRLTFWYVPEVRRWVKMEAVASKGGYSEALVEFKLNEN